MLNSKPLQALQFNASKHHLQIKLIQTRAALSSLYCYTTSCIGSRKQSARRNTERLIYLLTTAFDKVLEER